MQYEQVGDPSGLDACPTGYKPFVREMAPGEKIVEQGGPHRARIIRQQLRSLRQAGITHLPRAKLVRAADPPENALSSAVSPATHMEELTMARSQTDEGLLSEEAKDSAVSVALAERPAVLQVLQEEVAGCTLCNELAATRTQTVFGVGNPHAQVVFFGEAPGADEDRQGQPFVGRAGQLLDKIIAACTWQREDVYILNTLKCRPPNNRNPEADELSNCRSYWKRQLEIISPDYIVCLGKFAMQELLETAPAQSIGKMRKRFHDYQGAKVVVTYHPSYLLRNPAAKKDVWDDMKMLMREMGIEVPK